MDPLVILIADDNPTNLKLLRVLLEAEGYVIRAANDGVEALEILKRERVEAVVTDLLMPKLDGFRLCYEILHDAALQTIPIIVYTGTFTSSTDQKLCHELGADKFLRKPASAETLLANIREVTSVGWSKTPIRSEHLDEVGVIKEYNERLVAKLEENFIELEEKHVALKQANDSLSMLTRELDQRVMERTAQLEAANKELEAFSYSIAHDLRAPLRHILGYSAILAESVAGRLDPEQLQQLRNIQNATERMGCLIDELLAFSQSGRVELVKKTLSLHKLMEEAREELKPDLVLRQVDWEIGVLPEINGDEAMLKQVCLNLLSNAVKYTRKRDQAKIIVGGRRKGSEVECFVSDNGAGFDMRYVNKLFGVFQRLHSSVEFEGTGIGLANVRRIIERHGGRTWAEGKVGVGATVFFTLPSIT